MKIKRFSSTHILNTNGIAGFEHGRKYDQDMNRLGRGLVKNELTQTNQLHREMRKLNTELNNGRLGKWQDTH